MADGQREKSLAPLEVVKYLRILDIAEISSGASSSFPIIASILYNRIKVFTITVVKTTPAIINAAIFDFIGQRFSFGIISISPESSTEKKNISDILYLPSRPVSHFSL